MSLRGLVAELQGTAAYRELAAALERWEAPVAVLPGPARAWLAAALWSALECPLLLLTARPDGARHLLEQLQTILGEDVPLYLFPERESLPYERMMPDEGTIHQRLQVLRALTGGQGGAAPLVVSSVAAACQKTLRRTAFAESAQRIRVADRVRLDGLVASWLELGYRMEPSVEAPGAMSRRGGVLDVFVPGDPLPTRLELWGDEVESIRRFDPATQRSVERVDSVEVVACSEVLPSLAPEGEVRPLMERMDLASCSRPEAERIQTELSRLLDGDAVEEHLFYAGFFCHDTLLDYLPQGTLLVMDEASQLDAVGGELDRQAKELRAAKEKRGELPQGFPPSLAPWGETQGRLGPHMRMLSMTQWHSPSQAACAFPFGEPPRFWGRMDRFLEEAAHMLREGAALTVVTYHDQRLREILGDAGVPFSDSRQMEATPTAGAIGVVHGHLAEGWELRGAGRWVVVLGDGEVFGTSKAPLRASRRGVRRYPSLEEITPGSYVVHVDHGVARFDGTTWQADPGGAQREYLVLEYAEGDRLYVPTDHLDRVSPYVSPSDRPPSLTRLDGQEWQRVKRRVKESAREMAQELLGLYAAREVVEGISFSPDSPWERELEDSFPYVETLDQVQAIAEVKGDMQQPRPMDRLVCGDVGYGKTEVALRAAFKAVMNGMQVAVLVPTTVLAQQHYATFSQRLSPYPVQVEVLSRFRTRQEQAGVVESLKLGTVDICIGTHRLLQRDVGFKNLGLVIVDEEQRFGVHHKERLKQMRREVDVLTLTATPIPRTLHMALSSVRDMSTMETPPEERLPVKTYASEESDDLVREAVLRELDRGGQVFFVHNRVRSIGAVAASVRRLVPEATVAVAHGQMPEDQLAQVMEAFSKGQVDVLVCTTIIESGLDMPNANTLIIHRADLLGLAQLYQLRGRVGRAGQRAYCYLLVPRGKELTEAAEKRVRTILSATQLGSGFSIAMRDLEIRGAGNLLGAEQSGYIHAVGFDLYSRLLGEAVEELRDRDGREGPATQAALPSEEPRVRVDLPVNARIPEEYVAHLPTRLALYRRLMALTDRQALPGLRQELEDRFGPLPEEVGNLLYSLEVRILAEEAGVAVVTREGHHGMLQMKSPVGGARPALQKALAGLADVGNAQVRVPWHRQEKVWKERLLATLERLRAFRARVEESTLGVPEGVPRKPAM